MLLQDMLTLTSIKPATAVTTPDRVPNPVSLSDPPPPPSQVDANRSDEVIISLKQYLGSLPFAFKNATILSGQEEGLYGWVTVNYLMGNFEEVRSQPKQGGP